MATKYYTGIDGALYVNGTRIAKITAWTLQADVEVVETTVIDARARTYVFGRQQWSGSCTALYYENNASNLDTQLLLANTVRTTVLSPTATHTLKLQLSASRIFEATVLIQSATIQTSTSAAVEAAITFTVTGLPTTATMGAV
jgi:hypothetical protein